MRVAEGGRFRHPARVLEELGVSPRRRLSQSFLCQPAVARRIVSLAFWPPETPVVEVGAGTGFLTDAILERHGRVWAIELDRTLAAYLRERYSGTGVTVVEADARTLEIGSICPTPAGLFGNLPYGVTTDLIMWLIRQRTALSGAVIMVQREYAERLAARPGTKAYGSLSVFAAFRLRLRGPLRLGPGAFYPPPSVGSRVLACEVLPAPGDVDEAFVERVVRGGFAHRRKFLKTNLAAALGVDAAGVETAMAAVGAGPKTRAEELLPEQFLELARRLERRARR